MAGYWTCKLSSLVSLFLCPVTDISATVARDRREILHDCIGPGQVFSFGDDAPRGSHKSETFGLNFGRLTANISKTLSCSARQGQEFSKTKLRRPPPKDPPYPEFAHHRMHAGYCVANALVYTHRPTLHRCTRVRCTLYLDSWTFQQWGLFVAYTV